MSNPLPITLPLYPCKYCADDYSWPAEDLAWSEESKAWVCDACWPDYENGDPGITLADEIKRQADDDWRVRLALRAFDILRKDSKSPDFVKVYCALMQDEIVGGCSVVSTSSRCCQRGTHGCVIDHRDT